MDRRWVGMELMKAALQNNRDSGAKEGLKRCVIPGDMG